MDPEIIIDISRWDERHTDNLDDWYEHIGVMSERDLIAKTSELSEQYVRSWKKLLVEIGIDIDEFPEIVVLPSPYFRAECFRLDTRDFIIVHLGVMNILSFWVEMEELEIQLFEKWKDSETAKTSIHIFKNLALTQFEKYLSSPTLLPKLSNFIKLENRKNLTITYLAETFVILHEFAHIRCNHLSEPPRFRLFNDPIKKMEYEADKVALLIAGDAVNTLAPGITSFFWPYSLIQQENISRKGHYPTGVERLSRMLKNKKIDKVTRDIFVGELESLKSINSKKSKNVIGNLGSFTSEELNNLIYLSARSLCDEN